VIWVVRVDCGIDRIEHVLVIYEVFKSDANFLESWPGIEGPSAGIARRRRDRMLGDSESALRHRRNDFRTGPRGRESLPDDGIRIARGASTINHRGRIVRPACACRDVTTEVECSVTRTRTQTSTQPHQGNPLRSVRQKNAGTEPGVLTILRTSEEDRTIGDCKIDLSRNLTCCSFYRRKTGTSRWAPPTRSERLEGRNRTSRDHAAIGRHPP
jgi:hypothetical protein